MKNKSFTIKEKTKLLEEIKGKFDNYDDMILETDLFDNIPFVYAC